MFALVFQLTMQVLALVTVFATVLTRVHALEDIAEQIAVPLFATTVTQAVLMFAMDKEPVSTLMFAHVTNNILELNVLYPFATERTHLMQPYALARVHVFHLTSVRATRDL
jgi:hypothetical protein